MGHQLYETGLLISSSVVGVGSLIDGSQNAVWLLALEDVFCRIMEKAVKKIGPSFIQSGPVTTMIDLSRGGVGD